MFFDLAVLFLNIDLDPLEPVFCSVMLMLMCSWYLSEYTPLFVNPEHPMFLDEQNVLLVLTEL